MPIDFDRTSVKAETSSETLEFSEMFRQIIRFMNAHGGRPGNGARQKPSLNTDVEVTSGGAEETRTRRVLVVDDEAEFAANVSEVLATYGYAVRGAPNGFRAIEMVREEQPDDVLLDVRLPGMDGLATFRKLKEITPGIRVIMMTGYSTGEVLDKALREGARATLKKPLDFDKLVSLLEEK